MSDHRQTQKGFTLLELSAVMFIMAILLGMALPRFSNFFESDLEKDTRKIASIIDDLRLQAILKNESYRLVFDVKNSHYQIRTTDPLDLTKSNPHEIYKKPIKLTPSVQISKISTANENEFSSRFGFEKLEFDAIFGQQYEFRIDSSGFIDLFSIRLKDDEHSLTMRVKTIMGDLTIGQVTPL